MKKIDEDTLSRLIAFHWPGNVRELENVIERALILSEGSVLEIEESTFDHEMNLPKEQIALTSRRHIDDLSSQTQPGNIGSNEKVAVKEYMIQDETDTNSAGIINDSDTHFDLSQEDFGAAVKTALQHYVETDSLQQSPLLNSHSLNTKLGTRASLGESIECLRALIMEATTTLSKHPKTEIYARILHRTYYQPARSQELAADSLGLSYGTFRRHLTKARSWLTAELWQMEQLDKNQN